MLFLQVLILDKKFVYGWVEIDIIKAIENENLVSDIHIIFMESS